MNYELAINRILLITMLYSLMSCTFFIKNSQTEIESDKFRLRPVNQKILCSEDSRKFESFSSANFSAQETFKNLLDQLKNNNIHTTFIENTILWALIQINVRPDLSSPTSRLQMLIYQDGQPQYWDFSISPKLKVFQSFKKAFDLNVFTHPLKIKDNLKAPSVSPQKGNKKVKTNTDAISYPLPYLYGLDTILNSYEHKRTLPQLASLLDRFITKGPSVEEGLKIFLDNKKKELISHEIFRDVFFKDDEILYKKETLPKLSYSKLIQQYINFKKENKLFYELYSIQRHLFEISMPSDQGSFKIFCNHDMNLYHRKMFLIGPKGITGNEFSYQSNTGNHVIGISTQVIEDPTPLNGQFLIKGRPHPRGAALCFVEGQKTKNPIKLSMLSSKGRDPGQHLYQFFKHSLPLINDTTSLQEQLAFPRFLILLNPLRILFEGIRTNELTTSNILKLEAPIYHIPNLGNISSHFHFTKTNDYGFILDERQKHYLNCLTKMTKK